MQGFTEIHKILGPPGTGKTQRLLDLFEVELKTTTPDRIAFCSYTKKGSYEGRNRAMERFGYRKDDLPYCRTLHSIVYKEGGYAASQIIGSKHLKYFGEKIGMTFSLSNADDSFYSDDKYLIYDDIYRNNKLKSIEAEEGLDVFIVDRVRSLYQRFKEQTGSIDFTDMIEEFIKRGEALPVDVAFIDEAQDLTPLQWQLVHVAFANAKRIYIAADDDQALYEYRGADVKYFQDLKADKETLLDISWRLPDAVLEYAKKITSQIKVRLPKDYHGTGKEGNVFRLAEVDQLPLHDGEWYLLARTKYQLSQYKQYLRNNGFMYSSQKIGSSRWATDNLSMPTRHLNCIREYEAIRQNKKDRKDITESLEDLLPKNFNSWNAPWFEKMAFDGETLEYYRKVFQRSINQEAKRIHVSSIHGVKGGECENVALLLDVTRSVHKTMQRNLDQELRCYYVAATRTKNNLYLIDHKTEKHYPTFI